MLYNTGYRSGGYLYQKNHASMMLNNSWCWSAGHVVQDEPYSYDETSKWCCITLNSDQQNLELPEESDRYDNILLWIMISCGTGWVWCYTTLTQNQQDMYNKSNGIRMMLYTNQIRMLLYKHILIRRLYTRRSGSTRCSKKLIGKKCYCK